MAARPPIVGTRAFDNLRTTSKLFFDLAKAADTPAGTAQAILDRVAILDGNITLARRCYVRAVKKNERIGR